MRQLLFILTALTIHLTAFGQHDLGLSANCGLSYLDTKYHSNETVDKIYFQPSAQGGLFYNYNLNEKTFIGADYLFVQINGKEHLVIPETNFQGNPTGENMMSDISRHIYCFGFPIYYGYKIKKLTAIIGVEILYLLASSGQSKTTASTGIYESTADKLYIDGLDYGLRAGLLFNLTKKFTIETTYYYGLNNIYQDNNFKWTIQQVTVGLQYRLFSSGQTYKTEK